MAEKARPQCFFDVEINREPIGRIVFQLFSDVCPKTCTNFLCLCTGEKGIGKVSGKKLWYKGSTFHRVVKSFMIQGGDFSEGNGKGGESIFGGYFKDENFILKHDRAYLLSMANRGKHTNGSQFFITTKAAPHLDGVHVVFGLVISGFEVIEQIENLKTDTASRPYADVRVIDCGILGAKSTKDEKVRVATCESDESGSTSKSSSPSSSSSESSSESEAELERNKKRKRKRKPKVKHTKRKRKEGQPEVKEEKPQSHHHSTHSEKSSTAEDKDSGTKRDKPVVRPEEIPPIPENRFLLRKDAPVNIPDPELIRKQSPAIQETSDSTKGSITKSGRKIRGRGTIRYHTPPRSRSRSESNDDRESSETPPHWKEEMQRLKSYKPPTGEKWSKGDKLNERLPSRWDEGSLSPRSRSNSWSHDGYHSDTSRERDSHSKTRKKDKKVKHKKKSKKAKHSKKHKKKEEFSGSYREESSSQRRKYSQERTQRSSSRSSRESSKKGWSRSDKEQKSSRHSSHSKSRSRSYSKESGRSRTASKSTSRSRTRSRSRTESKSRKRNVSGSHSNSHSRSSKQTKASSSSPPKKDSSGSKANAAVHPGKLNSKTSDEPPLAFVTNEKVHVISLSDSPPPSRWKPGQKPWKPSYERIQEIKANAANALPTQSKYGSSKVKSNSYRKRRSRSESERSDYSGRSSSHRRKSKERSSSRGRSYSRSYSQSRSRSSSSFHAERVESSSYDSSSSSGSNDEIAHAKASSKKTKAKVNDKHMKGKQRKEKSKENSVSPKSIESRSDSTSSDTEGEEFTKRLLKTTKELLENQNSPSSKEEENNSVPESNMDGQNAKSDQDETQAVISDIDKVLKSDKLKESVADIVEEDPVPNSQNANVAEEAASSGKEEGEASTESDSEEVKRSNTPPSEPSPPPSEKRSKTPPSESSSPEHKIKSKKHKRRSSKKSMKKSRSKNKIKDKSKKSKEKKQKAQKKKQTFHWQPPLEFGEEEEDEEMPGGGADVQVKASNTKEMLPDKPSSTESKNVADTPQLIDKINTEPKILSLTSVMKTEEAGPLSKVTKSPLIANVEHTSEEIKTFTSHRSLPQIKLGTGSAARAQGVATTGKADQISSPSTSTVPASEERPQVKEEKNTQDIQPATSNSTSVEKAETGASEIAVVDNKWKPVQGPTIMQNLKPALTPLVAAAAEPEKKTQGLRIEIKSKNKVRPGSLFDEVRKTARLNQRPRNQESSSEERSSSHEDKSRSSSKAGSRSKSQTPSSQRSRSRSSSRSRSRYSSSSRSTSYTRSRSRRRYSGYRSRTRSRSYGSYRSYRTYSRSRSRSVSYNRRRRRSRSRSYTYDSYDSRSRSRSRSPSYYRSRRSRRSSYSGSERSYGHRRRHNGRS
ncbi:NK-tumor recognition protein isoform X2 [Dendropsophus ebraccatus]|uniref:NK-tumor recognition protein isoform X2 n=1 Tax=Dendropsophus ebraccatus TaxID=150705 RepID=UPI003831A6F2